MSVERRKVLTLLGASRGARSSGQGNERRRGEGRGTVGRDSGVFTPQQFKNPANPEIHFRTTGPEIWEDTTGTIDVLISGVGTGGTITGVSRYIKHVQHKPITSVAVEPEESPVITQKAGGPRTQARAPQDPGDWCEVSSPTH